jgi:hypothetical protein
MGFVNVTTGLRAIGYIERDELRPGPVAFITHSGSVFSALLRTRRHLGFTMAVSSGQELVTTTASYLDYALGLEQTKVVGLLLETLRQPERLRAALARAAAQDVSVVALTVGRSAEGRAMVAAHSGALAGDDGAWEALFDAYGVIRVGDLDEMADTLELFAAGRRAGPTAGPGGIASVHDSGPSGPWWSTWPPPSGSPSPPSPTAPGSAWPPSSTPASSPTIRSTCGAPVPIPRTSSVTRSRLWLTTTRSRPWPWPSTW